MTSIKSFDDFKNLIDGLEADADKFYSKGNGAAGTRLRKGLQEVKVRSQELRVAIQDIKNKN